MNRLYLAMFFACIVSHCFSQTKESDQLKDMINISVEKHILSELEWIKEKKIQKEQYGDQFFFEKEKFPTDFKFNDSIVRKYNVSFFEVSNFSRKRLKEGIGVLELGTICIKQNELLIDISNVYLTKKGKEIFIARDKESGFATYKFRYFCETKEWKLVGIRPRCCSDEFTLVE